jgi:hypothetical protein
MIAFVRRHGLALVATRGPDGTAQTAHFPVAITDQAEFVLELSRHSQKYSNIVKFPQVALKVGVDEPISVESEGLADVLTDPERDRCLRFYFQQFPAGRERAAQPDIVHVRIRPRWMRVNDLSPESFGLREIPIEPWADAG